MVHIFIPLGIILTMIICKFLIDQYDKSWQISNSDWLVEQKKSYKEDVVFHFNGYALLHNIAFYISWIGIVYLVGVLFYLFANKVMLLQL